MLKLSSLKLYLLCTLISLGLGPRRILAENGEAEGIWTSSESIKTWEKPAFGEQSYPWLGQVKAIILRSLNSPDQARDLNNLYQVHGTKALAQLPRYVGPLKLEAAHDNGKTLRQTLPQQMRLYVQKETKGDIFPQSWREGLKFQLGKGGGFKFASSSPKLIVNGDPSLRYGLELDDIEPNLSSMGLADLDANIYSLYPYAPKAELRYSIKEVYAEPTAIAQATDFSTESLNPSPVVPGFLQWQVPDLKFDGRMAPRGLPGPGSPLPPQSLFLDQVQGYYQVEAQLSGNLRQENVFHRFRLPVLGALNYRQERNKDWQLNKSSLENLYTNGKGFAIHLDRYFFDRRYQLNCILKTPLSNLELITHLPDQSLAQDRFSKLYRLESKIDFRF